MNGQNQSLSIITFEESASNSTPIASEVGENVTRPLNLNMHSCDTKVPADGILEGYARVKNASCTFCAEMCEPPTIDSEVHFFDGVRSKEVWTVLGLMVGITIVVQLYSLLYKRKKVNKEWEEMQEELYNKLPIEESNHFRRINDTASREQL